MVAVALLAVPKFIIFFNVLISATLFIVVLELIFFCLNEEN